MTNKERLINNNTRIQECIDKANSLPSTKGKPIKVNSLDELLLIEENVGNVYEYNNELYVIKTDNEGYYTITKVLSPEGMVEIEENGIHDVTNYEVAYVRVEPTLQEKTVTENGEVVADEGYYGLSKVNVNVASSGGAELNIHYGLTEPTDTSKLWLKCNAPSKVEVKNTIEGGEESIEVLENALPSTISGIATGVVGNKVYLFGGYDSINKIYLNTINVFDTETNSITTLSTPLPTTANNITSGVVGTKVYLFGGYDGTNKKKLNTINVFDTETNTITTLSTPLPTETINISSGVVGTKVYLFGGVGSNNYYLNTINVFDTETNSIKTLSTKLPTETTYMTSGVVGTKVYLFGGRGGSNSSYLNTINVFDTETNSIKTLSTPLPTVASSIASGVIGNKVYLFGGLGGIGSSISYLNTINVFDTETNSITTLSTPLPTAASNISSAVVGTKVYLFGGYDGSSYLNTINFFSIIYDINNSTLFILNQGTSNKVSIVKGDSVDVEIGVSMALLGNSNNKGESVPFAIHNGSEWVDG